MLAGRTQVLKREDYYTRALEQNLSRLRQFRDAFREGVEALPFGIQRQIVLAFVDDIVVEDRRELVLRFGVPFDNAGITELTDGIRVALEPEAETQKGPALSADPLLPGSVCRSRPKWLRKTRHARTADKPDSPLTVEVERPASPRRSPSKKRNKREKRTAPGALARALEYQELLGAPGIHTRADLARHLGVSRARVTQVMAVLAVPAPLMDTLSRAEAAGRPVTEGVWRRVKSLPAAEAVERLREWGYG